MLSYQSRISLCLRKKPQNKGARGMATLKAISIRLKSVKNIQKITQSMKMVSAAKYARAERELKQSRPLGESTKAFYTRTEPEEIEKTVPEEISRKTLYVAVASDRGLCGAVHSSVAKVIRNSLTEPGDNVKIVCIGDKSRSLLQRLYGPNILFVCQEVGRLPPTFQDASLIANEIFRSEFEFDVTKIIYNRYKSVVSYSTEVFQFWNYEALLKFPVIQNYEDAKRNTLIPFIEFSMATLIFYAMKEGACSEQSSRMTAMDNASKNAGEMISKLTLTFNRTRQAVITRELIEIISGASAL